MTPTNSSPIGAHTFIWSARWDHTGARLAATGAASAGFDLIEIPLLDPSIIDVADTRRLLESLGLGCTCSLGLPADVHLPSAPEEALSFLTRAVDVAADLGSGWLTGALYGSLGTLTGAAPTDEEIEIVGRALHRLAVHAEERGVALGLELINRYETYLLNTVEQAIQLIDRIDAPNVYAHLDTFHMNIEEPSFGPSVRRLGRRLGYVHLAESDRGVIGSGHFPFGEFLDSLVSIGYSGPLVVESFAHADAEIRIATATWRRDHLDPRGFAAESLRHVRALRDASLAKRSPGAAAP